MDGIKQAQIFAQFEGTEFKVKELIDDWILITYDIPVTTEGKIARGEFLKRAPRYGAVMHTRSVYLMPNTPKCANLALDLAKIPNANVFIWVSRIESPEYQRQLTEIYDRNLNNQVELIERRIVKIRKNIEAMKYGMANRMIDKSYDIHNQILFANQNRGSEVIAKKLDSLYQILKSLENVIDTDGDLPTEEQVTDCILMA